MDAVSPTVTEVRMQKGQLRQEQCLQLAANVPEDPTALQGPPDRACHFDKFSKR